MERNNRSKSIAILSIGVFFLCMLVLLFSSLKGLTKKYDVYFYDDDQILSVVTVEAGSSITDKQLYEIEQLVEIDDGYGIIWSHSKDKNEPVDFSKIYSDTIVYLLRIENEYNIIIPDSELYEYQVITDGPIKHGTSARVYIKHNIDKMQYQVNAYANGTLIEPDRYGYYDIENITQDVHFEIEYLEKARLKPIVQDSIYDGTAKDISYELYDYQSNLINSNDVEILIYQIDELGNETLVDQAINVGKYKVVYNCISDKYIFNSKTAVFRIDKAVPQIDVSDIELTYNGSPQGFKLEDVITTSDGEITFINNNHVDVGVYEVTIKVSGTNNFEAIKVTRTLEIVKATPIILNIPTTNYGYENHKLSEVNLINGLATVDGTFRWKEPDTILTKETNEYIYEFVPNNLDSYEIVEGIVKVDVLTIQETLDMVKDERQEIYLELLPYFTGTVTELPKLPTVGNDDEVQIIWMSTHTAIKVDNNGNVNIIGNDGIYEVTLYAYIRFGHTVEFIEYTFDLQINKLIEVDLELNEQIENPVVETTTAGEEDNTEEQILKTNVSEEVIEITYVEQMKVDLTTNTSENIVHKTNETETKENSIIAISTKQKQSYDYHAKVNNNRQISEVIRWKVISGEISDGSDSNQIKKLKKLENKDIYKKYNNSLMKGETK